MTIESRINLELYWQGPYTYNDWDISTVDIDIKEVNYDISADINTYFPSSDQQRLYFIVCEKERNFQEMGTKQINCLIELVKKSIKVSLRIFQTFDNRSKSGFYTYGPITRRDILPVIIGTLPNFQSGETYQIKLVNQNNAIRATIEQKIGSISNLNLKEKKKVTPPTLEQSQVPIPCITSGVGNGRMVKDVSFPNQDYNIMIITELEQQLEIANQKLIAARVSFDRAFQIGHKLLIMDALTHQVNVINQVIKIQTELEVLGVPRKDLSPPRCVIS